MHCGACTELPKLPWRRWMNFFELAPVWHQWMNACKQKFYAPIHSTLLDDFVIWAFMSIFLRSPWFNRLGLTHSWNLSSFCNCQYDFSMTSFEFKNKKLFISVWCKTHGYLINSLFGFLIKRISIAISSTDWIVHSLDVFFHAST